MPTKLDSSVSKEWKQKWKKWSWRTQQQGMKVTDTRSVDFLWYTCIFYWYQGNGFPVVLWHDVLLISVATKSNPADKGIFSISFFAINFSKHWNAGFWPQLFKITYFPNVYFWHFFFKDRLSVAKEDYIDVSVDLCFVFVPTKCWFINKVLYDNLKLGVVEYCFCLRLLRQFLVFCPYISIF